MPATLSSNNGEAQFLVELSAVSDYSDDPGFEASIGIQGLHYDGEHTFPFSTSIEGLCLRHADLVAVRDHIIRWLRQPLNNLIADTLTAEFQLAQIPNQSLRICFSPRADATAERHPVFSVYFSAGTLIGECYFVTDQSCLAIFAKELSTELVGVHPNHF